MTGVHRYQMCLFLSKINSIFLYLSLFRKIYGLIPVLEGFPSYRIMLSQAFYNVEITRSGYKLSEQIILNEIAGKNAAIHVYDKIFWVIRTGYITIVFDGRDT